MSSSDSELSNVSGDDSSKEGNGKGKLKFVKMLKNFPVLLEKSQVPTIKKSKRKALQDFKALLEQNEGKASREVQLMKKIHNMKTDVKKKTDKNKTGNKKIKLSEWEKEFLTLLQIDTNPTFSRIPGGQSVGLKTAARASNSLTQAPSADRPDSSGPGTSSSATGSLIPQPPKKAKEEQKLLAETDETSKLSTGQLQRLVPLEQLKLITMKQEKLSMVQPVTFLTYQGESVSAGDEEGNNSV